MLPKVKGELIRSIGKQMSKPDYISGVEYNLLEENPNLAKVCSSSVDVLNKAFCSQDITKETLLIIAQTVARTTYLMMYQALKQQDICDELEN